MDMDMSGRRAKKAFPPGAMRSGNARTCIRVLGCFAALSLLWSMRSFAQAPAGAETSAKLVWQLGEADGKVDEFIPIKYNHFLFDAPLLHRDEYDRRTNIFTYRVQDQGARSKPASQPGFPLLLRPRIKRVRYLVRES